MVGGGVVGFYVGFLTEVGGKKGQGGVYSLFIAV